MSFRSSTILPGLSRGESLYRCGGLALSPPGEKGNRRGDRILAGLSPGKCRDERVRNGSFLNVFRPR